mmetsp:Transcript_29138/g.73234  ORF Transcript_29138/g.73234 Transcript_29138/m.73234 type:complete len:115 (-) Transcript_29138:640-984(-)
MRANQICKQVTVLDIGERKDLLDQAVEVSPDLCAQAHFMRFEVLTASAMSPKTGRSAMEILENAVSTGRNLVELARLDDCCKGDFHSFMPTRWYVRSLFGFGSFVVSMMMPIST